MIFRFLHARLPSWLATPLCGGIYAGLIVAVWLKWDTAEATFRYAGL